LKVVTFKIYDDLLNELDNTASRLGVTRSEVIREAIKEYIRKARKPLTKKYIKIRHVTLH